MSNLNTILSNVRGHFEEEGEGSVITKKKVKTKKPPLYKVLLHNDDYTTMEFVIYVLKVIFGKNEQEAMDIMLNVHNNGVGVCGVYTHEIAETKVQRVLMEAKQEGHPLRCSFEPND